MVQQLSNSFGDFDVKVPCDVRVDCCSVQGLMTIKNFLKIFRLHCVNVLRAHASKKVYSS